MLAVRVGLAVDERAPHIGERNKLPNSALVEPLWHGDGCIGLSGLYAVLNAIRLVSAHKRHFDAARTHELLMAGLRFMDGRLTPSRAQLCGLRMNMWRQLVEALSDHVRSRHQLLVFTDQLHVDEQSTECALSAIERAIDRRRAVMLLMRGGRYTVVGGYTPSSLLLFDSGGACWISRRITRVPGECGSARHVVYPSSFMTLRA